jgi:HSP20 family protein
MLGSLIPWKKAQDVSVRREEGNPLAQFRREVDQLWDRLLNEWNHDLSGAGQRGGFGMGSNLEEEEKAYVLRAELPGFEPAEIDIKLSGNVLTVSAEHKAEDKKGNGSRYHYGSYSETFTLPQGVIADQIDARYHSGVLEVHLPKTEESKAKRIDVKSA